MMPSGIRLCECPRCKTPSGYMNTLCLECCHELGEEGMEFNCPICNVPTKTPMICAACLENYTSSPPLNYRIVAESEKGYEVYLEKYIETQKEKCLCMCTRRGAAMVIEKEQASDLLKTVRQCYMNARMEEA